MYTGMCLCISYGHVHSGASLKTEESYIIRCIQRVNKLNVQEFRVPAVVKQSENDDGELLN